MDHLRIDAVPLLREGEPPFAPAAYMAQHLQPDGEYLELRLCREEGGVRCYLGFSSRQRMMQAIPYLMSAGCLCRADVPGEVEKAVLLSRSVQRRPVVRAGAAAGQELLPSAIETDPLRSQALFRALARGEKGSGVSFLFRRAPALPLGVVSHLHRLSPDPVAHRLLRANELFEGVVCVFGSPREVEQLTSEVMFAFPGLAPERSSPQPVGAALFDRLAAPIPVCDVLQRTFLREELELLGDITPSAGDYGLPISKDTILGVPRPFRGTREPGPAVRLGFSGGGLPLELPLRTLRRHMAIFGEPGSGKGNQLFCLASQLHEAGVPVLLIESAKQEMHHLQKVIQLLRTWQPKEGEFLMNPFSLEGDITLGEMRPALLQLLRTCFKLDGPLEELFSDTLNRCFSKFGYRDDSCANSPGASPFGLHEFMESYAALLEERGYSERTRSDMRTAGLVRLGTLFNQDRGVFDTAVSIPMEELLNGANLLQLNCLPTVESKQMFASMLLIKLAAYLRLRGSHCGDKPLKLAIIVDEAHNLLQPAEDSQGRPYSFARDFSNMLLELRSQGVAIILADQSAHNIPAEITGVCATKMFLGPSLYSGVQENRQYLNADELALQHLYLLGPGEGLYVTSGMPRGAYFKCPDLISKFALHVPCGRFNGYLRRNSRLTLETFRECALCPARGQCTHGDKSAARQRASLILQRYGGPLSAQLRQKPSPQRDKALSGLLLSVVNAAGEGVPSPQSRWCTAVQVVREFNREHPGALVLETLIQNAQTLWSAQE